MEESRTSRDSIFTALTLWRRGAIACGQCTENERRAHAQFACTLRLIHLFACLAGREFSAIVFIVNLYPNTLFYSALFGLVENLVGIIFGPYVGALIDVHDRLRAISWSIIGQNVSIALASLVFWMALSSIDTTQENMVSTAGGSHPHPKSQAFIGLSYFFILCMGGTAQVAATANKVSLHKDWVPVVAATSATRLTALNSSMRRIDLTANILAPVLVGLVSWGASPAIAVMCVGIWSVLSLVVELLLARRVYWKIEPLRHKPKAEAAAEARRLAAEAAAAEGSMSSSSSRSFAALSSVVAEASLSLMQRVAEFTKRFLASLRAYHAHPVFRASIAYALLYMSVLSLGGIMTSWLKLRGGVSDALLAGVRAIAALVGVIATYASPWMIRRWGLLQSALLSIWLQVLLLLPVTLSFLYYFRSTSAHLVILFVFLCASRFGLWSFDLAETQIMQSRVDPAEAGAINGAQEAAINCCYTCGFVMAMIFHDPAWFVAPACISFLAVLGAALIYTGFVTEQMRGANPFPKLETLMLHRHVEFQEAPQPAEEADGQGEQQYAEDQALEIGPSADDDEDDDAYPDQQPQLHDQQSYRYE